MIGSGIELVGLLGQMLKPLGFRKAGNNWRLETAEAIVVVNLQKSAWGNTYYLNLGAFVKSIEDEPGRTRNRARPSIVDCHYRIRIEDLLRSTRIPPAKISPEQARIHALLDFDLSLIDPAIREEELTSVIEQHVVPFLALCKSEAGIRIAIIDKLRSSYMTTPSLRERLGIPSDL